MATTITAAATKARKQESAKTKTDLLTRIFGDLETKRFAITPTLLIWTVCLGGVVVSLGAMESIAMLTAIVLPSMAILAFCLAVQPVRAIIWLTLSATIIDLSLIAFLLLV